MNCKTKAILIFALLALISISRANASVLVNGVGASVEIQKPVRFLINQASIPTELNNAISRAADEINAEAGSAVVLIEGFTSLAENRRDGLNTISFSRDFAEYAGSQSHMTMYFKDVTVNEVDIVVNSNNFNYTQNPQLLVDTLKEQFSKIVGQGDR